MCRTFLLTSGLLDLFATAARLLFKASNFLLGVVSLALIAEAMAMFKEWHDAHLELWTFIFYENIWVIWSVGGIGIYLFTTVVLGIVAAQSKLRCLLVLHILLTMALALAEVAAGLFCALEPSWESLLPADRTGQLDKLKRLILRHWVVSEWCAGGVISLQAANVLLGALLMRLPAVSEEDCEDGRERLHRPLLQEQ